MDRVRLRRAALNKSRAIPNTATRFIPPDPDGPPNIRLTNEVVEPEAVVVTVRVTGTVVVEEVKLMLAGLKLQALPAGKLEHIDGVSVVDPVNPA